MRNGIQEKGMDPGTSSGIHTARGRNHRDNDGWGGTNGHKAAFVPRGIYWDQSSPLLRPPLSHPGHPLASAPLKIWGSVFCLEDDFLNYYFKSNPGSQCQSPIPGMLCQEMPGGAAQTLGYHGIFLPAIPGIRGQICCSLPLTPRRFPPQTQIHKSSQTSIPARINIPHNAGSFPAQPQPTPPPKKKK